MRATSQKRRYLFTRNADASVHQTRSVWADRPSAYCRGQVDAIAVHFVRFPKRFAIVGVARFVATAARRNNSYRGFFRVRMIAALSSPPYTKIAAIEYR
jgi:hypothetical protein